MIDKMVHQVEFFGVPRARAGVVQAEATGETLGEVLADLANKFPELAEACIQGNQLRPGYTVNLGGERFTTDSNAPLKKGETLLLMSLDAGG